MGLVMKEAEKAVSGGGSGDKQSMLNGAAMTLTKLVTQQQLSAFIGGSNSGGLGMLDVGKTVRVSPLFYVAHFDGFHIVAQERICVTRYSDVQLMYIELWLSVKVNWNSEPRIK